MTLYTPADLRALCIIAALIALTGYIAARYAATGAGFTILTALTLITLTLILAWARRRSILEHPAVAS